MEIIDANTKISDVFDGAALVEHMNGPVLIGGKQMRIEKALTLNRPGLMDRKPPSSPQDYDKIQDWLIDQVKKNPTRLIPVMPVNPYFEQEHALELLEKLVRNNGFRALKLHPNIHNFRPNDDIKVIAPIIEKCGKLNIPVMIHSGDPYSEPSRIEAVAQAFRDVRIIMLHFGTQTGSYAVDAIGVTKRNENVWLETSWALFGRLKDAVKAMGPDKLIFGSDAPVNDIWTQAMLVSGLHHKPPLGTGLDEEGLAKIFGGNIRKVARLS
jgi:uncharacterized protein